MSSSPSYLDPVVLRLLVGESVLDVGCGYGRWCHLMQSNYWEAGLAKPPVVDGFDAFEPNVERCRQSGCYRNVWHQVLPSPIKGRWDTVLAVEVLEHVPQEGVDDTVERLELAAERRVVITMPRNAMVGERGGLEQIGGFNEYEAHRSSLPISYFRSRGYQVRGAGLTQPTLERLRLTATLTSATFRFPWLAGTIVAYKDT
jgi:SAM-dependent methyltransferase